MDGFYDPLAYVDDERKYRRENGLPERPAAGEVEPSAETGEAGDLSRLVGHPPNPTPEP